MDKTIKNEDFLLQMHDIRKSFDGVEVLHGVDLNVKRGEVLALVGENGAGKSTMIKILAGNFPQTSGEIFLDGIKLGDDSPIKRINCGISVIYQELNYYNELSIAENIFAGNYPTKGIWKRLDRQKMNSQAAEALKKVKLFLPPNTLCKELSIAEKQLLEIAKALSKNAKLIVMDEPTSALNDTEVANLFSIIRDLRENGVSVIYISHKLDEIFEICDRIQIMRDGESISVCGIKEIDRAEIVSRMVGRSVNELFKRNFSTDVKEEILSFENATTEDGKTRNITFHVNRGEIVTLYGLMGSGRGHILETCFGLHRLKEGFFLYKGKEMSFHGPGEAIANGVAFVPSERKTEGLILSHSIKQNISLTALPDFCTAFSVNRSRENQLVDDVAQKMSIKATGTDALVSSLSGGNQQKVVVGKWLHRDLELLIVHEPTKGIDVGTKQEIYKLLDEMCQKNVAVLMVTSELPEVLSLSDRIYIVRDGSICDEVNGTEATQEILMQKAIGGSR